MEKPDGCSQQEGMLEERSCSIKDNQNTVAKNWGIDACQVHTQKNVQMSTTPSQDLSIAL